VGEVNIVNKPDPIELHEYPSLDEITAIINKAVDANWDRVYQFAIAYMQLKAMILRMIEIENDNSQSELTKHQRKVLLEMIKMVISSSDERTGTMNNG